MIQYRKNMTLDEINQCYQQDQETQAYLNSERYKEPKPLSEYHLPMELDELRETLMTNYEMTIFYHGICYSLTCDACSDDDEAIYYQWWRCNKPVRCVFHRWGWRNNTQAKAYSTWSRVVTRLTVNSRSGRPVLSEAK